MAYQGLPFAGSVIKVDDVVLGLVTSAEITSNIDEAEVTGAEDVSGSSPDQISAKKYRPVGIDKTVAIAGIYKPGDAGQTDLKDAADTGAETDLEVVDQAGYGADLTGFFTNFVKSGALAGVYTFTATFRVNSETAITPGS
jgi:hypothetical protein